MTPYQHSTKKQVHGFLSPTGVKIATVLLLHPFSALTRYYVDLTSIRIKPWLTIFSPNKPLPHGTTCIIPVAFVCSLDVDGQNRQKERYASSIDYDKLQKHNPSLFNYQKEIDRKATEYSQKKNNDPSPNIIPKPATVVTIPIVVHIHVIHQMARQSE